MKNCPEKVGKSPFLSEKVGRENGLETGKNRLKTAIFSCLSCNLDDFAGALPICPLFFLIKCEIKIYILYISSKQNRASGQKTKIHKFYIEKGEKRYEH